MKCEACGHEIVFAKVPNGKLYPFDAVTVLAYDLMEPLKKGDPWHASPVNLIYISHTLTCPAREDFAKRGVRDA
ncbi:MAG: hypothetical protein ACE5F1_01520 [Planctomycetota bacterium]